MEPVFERLQSQHVVLNVPGDGFKSCLESFLGTLESRKVLTQAQRKALATELLSREAMGGTGIGRGVVLPHAYLKQMPEPLLLFARLHHSVPHTSPDALPVDLVFLMTGPLDSQSHHLSSLARLVRLLHDNQLLEDLRHADSDSAVMEALHAVERRHV
ncbi:MAG: PTS sugar transporter subunit IIA [Deltaproteobacteria bacterium]|nr:PTS sugar transporter subunit IIA [Deltaproteobacteria bacterium]